MKKFIVVLLALLATPAFAYFGTERFGADPFGQASYDLGPFNERASTVAAVSSGTWYEEDGNSDLQPLAAGGSDLGWFEEDGNSDLQPDTSGTDTYYELDGNLDIMPKA